MLRTLDDLWQLSATSRTFSRLLHFSAVLMCCFIILVATSSSLLLPFAWTAPMAADTAAYGLAAQTVSGARRCLPLQPTSACLVYSLSVLFPACRPRCPVQ